jgi:hypothetical protein
MSRVKHVSVEEFAEHLTEILHKVRTQQIAVVVEYATGEKLLLKPFSPLRRRARKAEARGRARSPTRSSASPPTRSARSRPLLSDWTIQWPLLTGCPERRRSRRPSSRQIRASRPATRTSSTIPRSWFRPLRECAIHLNTCGRSANCNADANSPGLQILYSGVTTRFNECVLLPLTRVFLRLLLSAARRFN